MNQDVLLALIIKWVDERLERFSQEEVPLLKGPRGERGRPGHDFVFEEHQDSIKAIILEKSDEIFARLSERLPELKGQDGKDGKDFNFEEHKEEIEHIVSNVVAATREDLKLKFSDLTEDEVRMLRGPRGQRGKPGKDFVFEENQDEIKVLIDASVLERKDELKLKFSDLTKEEVENLKLKFEDLSESDREGLKLKFENLTEEDKNSLKLKFSDLTEEETEMLRGPRGVRGQRGKRGHTGEQGPRGEKGDQGERGPIGPRGAIGPAGLEGRPGKDGVDAPKITRVDLQKEGSNVWLRFEFDNGDVIETNPVVIPSTAIGYVGVVGGGGGGSGTPGPEGPQGPQGPQGPEGPQGPPGLDATIEFFDEGVSLGTATEVNFTGLGVSTTKVGDRVNVSISGGGGSGLEVIENIPCDASVYVGAAVRMEYGVLTELNMDQWTLLALIPRLDVLNYTPLAVNALADAYENSNVIGLVESKPSSTLCNIRITGISAANYLGLDIFEEYYLSDEFPGGLVPLNLAPVDPGKVLVRIGQPITPTQMLYSRGERVLRG